MKFPYEIRDKKQLAKVFRKSKLHKKKKNFYQDIAKKTKPSYARLQKKKKSSQWTTKCTKAVQKLRLKVKELPCLALPHLNVLKNVETNASDLGYGGILKQSLRGEREFS